MTLWYCNMKFYLCLNKVCAVAVFSGMWGFNLCVSVSIQLTYLIFESSENTMSDVYVLVLESSTYTSVVSN